MDAGGSSPGSDRPSDPGAEDPESAGTGRAHSSGSRLWYLLLLPSYVGLLWVPFYASRTPELFGFPFFYWFQFAWVPLTALLTWIVYLKVR
jgi:hypothetical protein